MSDLAQCPHCQRHVRAGEATCPFCEEPLGPAPLRVQDEPLLMTMYGGPPAPPLVLPGTGGLRLTRLLGLLALAAAVGGAVWWILGGP